MGRFRANYAGIGQMLVSEEMQQGMATFAEPIKGRAVAGSPVAKTGKHRGRYKSRWRVEKGVRREETARAYAKVINDAPEAALVEFKRERGKPPQRVLGKALSARPD